MNVGTLTNNATCFFSIGAHGNVAVTESDRTIEADFDFYVERVRANLPANTKDGTTNISFRDDGQSIGTLQYLTGVTGKKDSGELNVKVLAGSLICFLIDTTGSTINSLQALPVVAVIRPC